MRIEVCLTPGEVDPARLHDATVVVVDVLRATTSMIEALANGARAIFPVRSTEDGVRLTASLGREDTLLCGERKGVKIEGFDLGNSPSEFAREVVEGKRLVWSTTNGTAAFAAVQEAREVVAGAFTNLSAVAGAVTDREHVVLLCAGRDGRFSIDDAFCAGLLVRRLADGGRTAELDDGARAARMLAEGREPDRAFLEASAAGQALTEVGLGADLDDCADVDRHGVVPRMRDQALVLDEGG